MPLDHYLDLIIQSDQRWMDLAAAGGHQWEVDQEEFIAECMKDEGFTYYPREVEAPVDGPNMIQGAAPTTVDIPWLPADRADVERYGYGHGGPEALVGDDGSMDPVDPDGSDEPHPNDTYFDSLSPSAQQAYEVAMSGAEWAGYDLADYATVAAPEMGGCMGAAWEAHPSPSSLAFDASPVHGAYEGLADRIRAQGDPYSRVADGADGDFLGSAAVDALDAEWAACFAEVYGEVEQPDVGAVEPREDGTLVALPGSVSTPRGAWYLALFTDPDGGRWLGSGDPPEGYGSLIGSPAEIGIALADWDCRARTNYVETFLEIMRESQEQFVADNRSQLDEFEAAVEVYVND